MLSVKRQIAAKVEAIEGTPENLAAADAIPLDMSKVKSGDKIPRTMLNKYTGAQGVIETKTAYAGGKWQVVFHRKLKTGFPDDVVFAQPASQPLGLAAFNDLDNFNHTVVEQPYTLKFQ